MFAFMITFINEKFRLLTKWKYAIILNEHYNEFQRHYFIKKFQNAISTLLSGISKNEGRYF